LTAAGSKEAPALSFSSDVKKELAGIIPSARHCRIAELAAVFACIGRLSADTGTDGKRFYLAEVKGENAAAVRKYFTLLRKTTNIKNRLPETEEEISAGNGPFSIALRTREELSVLTMLKLVGDDGTVRSPEGSVSPILLKNDCCRRAYLRGMFLCIGSMSDPGREYHLEYVCTAEEQAEQIRLILQEESIAARIVRRRKYLVVYVKDSAAIIDVLNLMGADVSLMNMENSRILKEIANSVNRRVNCETSNLLKTVTASGKQADDIRYIRSHGGLGQLPENVRQTAELRLLHEDSSLKELGEISDPPVGRSGINHRLRKISEIAEELRKKSAL
jgi:DNA-binding protein WhiA